jgi:hypothetical protein
VVTPYGSVWDGAFTLYLGRLATLLGRFEPARHHLGEASDLHARLGARPYLADAWLARAQLHEREGQRTDASRLAADAAGLYRALGMFAAEKQANELVRLQMAPGEPGRVNRLARSGRRWRIRYLDGEAHVADVRGMTDLATLLARPGEPIHVLDLTAGVAGADLGELLDARARDEMRTRMRELMIALEEAERHHDTGRSEVARAELEQLEDELARGLGLGGRARRAGDPVERARKTVYNRIRTALAGIEVDLPELAAHLHAAIRTGRTCVYLPDPPAEWRIEL